jgi:hypothetical protein
MPLQPLARNGTAAVRRTAIFKHFKTLLPVELTGARQRPSLPGSAVTPSRLPGASIIGRLDYRFNATSKESGHD